MVEGVHSKHEGHGHDHDHEHDGCACSVNQEGECGCGHEHTGGFKKHTVRLWVGIMMFGAAIALTNIFVLPWVANLALFLAAYLVLGANVIAAAARNIIKGKVFDENFLMTVATAGAFVLGEYIEGTAVMLFYLIGETLSDLAVERSKRSITELMDIRPDYANVERDGSVMQVAPDDVRVGEIIVIKPYEKTPLDSVVEEGYSSFNTSALTGESVPADVSPGSSILSGSVNGGTLVKARVEKPYGESTAAKILDIVEHASSRKSTTEKFITRFARYYTPIVCAGALAVAVIPSLVTGEWSTWIYRALLFLVISCPCALVVAVPLTYFAGIGGASKKGILIKGANYLEALDNVSEVVFDKTGTLTKGEFAVQDIVPADGVSEDDLIAAAAHAEVNSAHPIAKSVLRAYGKEMDGAGIADYTEVPGHGVKADVDGVHILAGNARMMREENIEVEEADVPGTVLYLARDGRYMGHILIADTLKRDARQAAAELTDMGVGTAMLTGDSKAIADNIAAEVGVRKVYSELLPQDKVDILEKISEQNRGTAFVGDGINDAPVLARADVGIAMGALGSDAAIEAADVVLMTDEPSKVPLALRISKRTKRIVIQNIVFALAVKAVVMVLGVVGIADMWAAVFADVGVTLVAILNALRALRAT